MASTQLLLLRALSHFSYTAVAVNFSRLHAARSMASAAEPFEKVQIQRDDTTFDAYVIGKENAPGIVVVQEWWGIDFEVKKHAQKIANLASGYRALIPDLYRGKVGLDVAEAQHLLDGLDWPGAVKDISASVKWLKANGSPKVGVTGFCMGGALSIASAVLVPEVDAAVGFYGAPSAELADAAKAKAPVQAHFGELDSFVGFSDVTSSGGGGHQSALCGGCRHENCRAAVNGVGKLVEIDFELIVLVLDVTAIINKVAREMLAATCGVSPPSYLNPITIAAYFINLKQVQSRQVNSSNFSLAAKQLEEKLKDSGVSFEVYVYPGVGHAFLNDSPEGKQRRKDMGMNDEDPAAVELAWSRFSTWMSKYLSS